MIVGRKTSGWNPVRMSRPAINLGREESSRQSDWPRCRWDSVFSFFVDSGDASLSTPLSSIIIRRAQIDTAKMIFRPIWLGRLRVQLPRRRFVVVVLRPSFFSTEYSARLRRTLFLPLVKLTTIDSPGDAFFSSLYNHQQHHPLMAPSFFLHKKHQSRQPTSFIRRLDGVLHALQFRRMMEADGLDRYSAKSFQFCSHVALNI